MSNPRVPRLKATNRRLDQLIAEGLQNSRRLTAELDEDGAYLLAALLLDLQADKIDVDRCYHPRLLNARKNEATVLRMAARKARRYAFDLRARN